MISDTHNRRCCLISDFQINLRKEGSGFPIVFKSFQKDFYEAFTATYNPLSGFFVCKDKDNYVLFCGNHRFKCSVFSDQGTPLGFWVHNCDEVSQKHTIDMATRAVVVNGVQKDQILLLEEKPAEVPFNQHFRKTVKDAGCVGFERTLKLLQEMLKKRNIRDNPSKISRYSAQRQKYWQDLIAMSQRKQAFAELLLIQWNYSGYDVLTRDDTTTSTLYRFHIDPLETIIQRNEAIFEELRRDDEEEPDPADEKSMEALVEEYTKHFAPKNLVEILLTEPGEDGKYVALFATIAEFEAEQDRCLLTLSFEDKNSHTISSVPTSGTMKEHISPDYRNYILALNALRDMSSQRVWDAAEQIIQDQCAQPIPDSLTPTYESKNLTPSQKKAIKMALNAKDFLLVQGPPGTGKTTIIAEMVRNFVERDQRVLICSKGNLAVDNVLEKWIKENKMRPDGHLCIRLGKEDRIKLDLIKDYTASSITVMLQEQMHRTCLEEREKLIQHVDLPLEKLHTYTQWHISAVSLCSLIQQFFDYLDTLSEVYPQLYDAVELPQKFGIHPNMGNLPGKQQSIEWVRATLYHRIYMPLALLLCREAAPTEKDIAPIRKEYQAVLSSFQWMLLPGNPGFWAKLLAKEPLNELAQREAMLSAWEKPFRDGEAILNAMTARPENVLLNNDLCRQQLRSLTQQIQNHGNMAAVCQSLKDLPQLLEVDRQRYLRLRGVLHAWLTELGSGKSASLEQAAVFDCVPVIGSTCMSVMSDSDYKPNTFDVVIVDEAGQIPIYDLLVPIIRAKKVILIGDHLQLPPISEQDFARHYAKNFGEPKSPEYEQAKEKVEELYNVSLFEKLYNAPGLEDARTMIDMQFRMPKAICDFVSKTFYGGQYKSGIDENGRMIRIAGRENPIYFYDTRYLPKEKRQETLHNPGCSNNAEAALCAQILVELILAIRSGNYAIREKADLVTKDGKYDIGVISGYGKQVEAIREQTLAKLQEHMSLIQAQEELDKFMISSVDSFQGRDNEIILFSMTRSNDKGKVGFLRDVRRLNVAMTRAKSMLIMVGDSSTLLSCKKTCEHDKTRSVSSVYEALIRHCAALDSYYNEKGERLNGLPSDC